MVNIEPFITDGVARLSIILTGFVITIALSGVIVRIATGHKGGDRPGCVIGKAENVLTLLFVLGGEITGLALIVAAKQIIRHKDDGDPAYMVGGTLVNLAWGLIVGLIVRVLVFGYQMG